MKSAGLWPSHFSIENRAKALALVQSFRESLRSYDGRWAAAWLLNGVFDVEWRIADISRGREDIRTYSWELHLPNGTSLLDECNQRMLRAAQKSAFLVRTLPGGGCPSSIGFLGFLHSQATLIRWLYLHEDIYRPADYAYKRLGTAAVEEFISKMYLGGVPWVLDYPLFFLLHCYQGIQETLPESSRRSLEAPSEQREKIIAWLAANRFYRAAINDRSQQFLDRRKIAAALGFDLQTIKSHARFSAFLRQFEPTVLSPLLVGREHRREFPSHRVPTLEDAKDAPKGPAGQGMHRMLVALLRLHRHLPDEIPDSSQFDFRRINRRISNARSAHTPWVPLDVALKYTTEALRWVHLYGTDLVTYVLDVARILERYARTENIYCNLAKREAIVRAVPVPPSLAPLHISGLTSALSVDCAAFDRFRESPSLGDALSVLVGAIVVLVTITKPSREREITSLTRDCIYFVKGDGYWLDTRLGKSGTDDYRLRTRKPVPAIAAKGLDLLVQLGDGLTKIGGDVQENAARPLFCLPDRDAVRLTEVSPMTTSRINAYLDRFCDWVNLPTDSNGRRWYIRTHEARKSFLITFFWCYRFGGLDAARWMAGHTNAADVYAYIEANFPGEELPALEAQYAVAQLWAFESGEKQIATENTAELYDLVRKAFRVNAIDLVPEEELLMWLTMRFRNGDVDIEPYSIREAGDVVGTRICFRISAR